MSHRFFHPPVVIVGAAALSLAFVAGCSSNKGPTAPTTNEGSAVETTAAAPVTPRTPSALVTPIYVEGNPTCPAGLFEEKFDPPTSGTRTIGSLGSITLTASGSSVSWTSTFGIDVVIVKGGPVANVYTYDPPAESLGDTGLVTPTNPSNGQPYGLSHVSFCYDIELQVTKTAATTFTRDYDWTILKSASPTTLNLTSGQSGTVNYSVAVTKDSGTDSNWSVGGNIVVHNPHPSATAHGIAVSDTISGYGGAVTVTCPASSLGPGASMTCTYGPVALPDGTARTNTATATSTTAGIGAGTGTASITFGTPSTVLDNCVNVSDTYAGAFSPNPKNICASQTLTYSRTFAANDLSCGANTIQNTASLATDDGATETSGPITVTVNVTCITTDQGCSPGYWKNHTGSWPPTGYSVGQTIGSVFSGASAYPTIASSTLLQGLNFTGGSGNEGAARNLMRAAVAALLNAASPSIEYPRTTAQVVSQVNAALASGDRATMLALASQLDTDNNLFCPLS